jgi:imidazolonepropionase-like amidohydrolase
VVERAIEVLSRARKAGIPFLVGTDSGFAVTPYGEWHARELEIMVDDLGFAPAEALAATTVNNARVLREHAEVGALAPGKLADFIVVDRDVMAVPAGELKDTRVLETWVGGELVYSGPSS